MKKISSAIFEKALSRDEMRAFAGATSGRNGCCGICSGGGCPTWCVGGYGDIGRPNCGASNSCYGTHCYTF